MAPHLIHKERTPLPVVLLLVAPRPDVEIRSLWEWAKKPTDSNGLCLVLPRSTVRSLYDSNPILRFNSLHPENPGVFLLEFPLNGPFRRAAGCEALRDCFTKVAYLGGPSRKSPAKALFYHGTQRWHNLRGIFFTSFSVSNPSV